MPDGGRATVETGNDMSTMPMCIDTATLNCVFEPNYITQDVGCGTGLDLSQGYGFVKQSLGILICNPRQGTAGL